MKIHSDGKFVYTNKGTFKISEIYDYYMEHTKNELAAHFNVSERYMKSILHEAGIKKPIEKVLECIKKTNLKKYGVELPFESNEIQRKIIQTNLEKYGYENQFSRPEIIDKIKDTTISKYGVEYYSQTEEHKIKSKLTCLERYGVENYSLTDEYKSRVMQTNNSRYGVDYYSQTAEWGKKVRDAWDSKSKDELVEIEAKRKLARLLKYGNENYTNNDKRVLTLLETYGTWDNYISSINEKAKETKLERYGDENYNNREKAEQTMINKYGVRSYTQTPVSKTNRRKLYIYDGEYFDSLSEVAYYIYMIDNGHKVTRCPYTIEYIFNDKTHIYHPDFMVDGELVEIKGNQFFEIKNDKNSRMVCPYNHTLDNLFEAKHQCMIKNNVKIILSSECKEYIKYISELDITIHKIR